MMDPRTVVNRLTALATEADEDADRLYSKSRKTRRAWVT